MRYCIVQIMAHPLRSQILELFGDDPLTVKQVADRLGMTANRLYYHVNLLEEHGLLRVVETRTVGNLIEKLYRTAAERFEIDANLLAFSTVAGQENAEQLVVSTLDATRQDLLRSIEARQLQRLEGRELKPRQAIVSRCLSRLSDARAEAFRQRLSALMEEFGAADEGPPTDDAPASGGEGEVQPYALTIAYYMTAGYPEQEHAQGEA